MNQAALYFMPVLESARNENSSDDDRQHRLFRFIYPEDIWRSWCIDRLQRFKIIQPQIVVFFLWIFQSPHGSFARQLLVIDKVVCLMDSTKFLSFCKLDPCMIRNSPRIIIIIPGIPLRRSAARQHQFPACITADTLLTIIHPGDEMNMFFLSKVYSISRDNTQIFIIKRLCFYAEFNCLS